MKKSTQLVADGDGFEEDRDEYTSEGIFFVPAGARWSDVSAKAHDPEIGQVIDDAMRAIEKENARLKDILPKNFARPELDKRRLGEVVDLFTNIKMIEHGSEKDILGRTYPCLQNRKASVAASSLRRPVLCEHWWKCCNHLRDECMTLAAAVVVCLFSLQNL